MQGGSFTGAAGCGRFGPCQAGAGFGLGTGGGVTRLPGRALSGGGSDCGSLGLALAGLGRGQRGHHSGNFSSDFSGAAAGTQASRCRIGAPACPAAIINQPVPAPQLAGSVHQPLARVQRQQLRWRRRSGERTDQHANLRQPACQLGRGLYMIKQRRAAVRQRWIIAGDFTPGPAARRGRIGWASVHILAQCRCQRRFMARRGHEPIRDARGLALIGRQAPRQCGAFGFQAGQRCTRGSRSGSGFAARRFGLRARRFGLGHCSFAGSHCGRCCIYSHLQWFQIGGRRQPCQTFGQCRRFVAGAGGACRGCRCRFGRDAHGGGGGGMGGHGINQRSIIGLGGGLRRHCCRFGGRPGGGQRRPRCTQGGILAGQPGLGAGGIIGQRGFAGGVAFKAGHQAGQRGLPPGDFVGFGT